MVPEPSYNLQLLSCSVTSSLYLMYGIGDSISYYPVKKPLCESQKPKQRGSVFSLFWYGEERRVMAWVCIWACVGALLDFTQSSSTCVHGYSQPIIISVLNLSHKVLPSTHPEELNSTLKRILSDIFDVDEFECISHLFTTCPLSMSIVRLFYPFSTDKKEFGGVGKRNV